MALIGDFHQRAGAGPFGLRARRAGRIHQAVRHIKKRIVVTCFASNIARLKSIARGGEKNMGVMSRWSGVRCGATPASPKPAVICRNSTIF